MGTRSTILIKDEKNHPLLMIYGMYDGQHDGVGETIFNYLNGRKLVLMIEMGDTESFNGMGDLALRLVVHLKGNDMTGDWFAINIDSKQQYFHYEIIVKNDGNICIDYYKNKELIKSKIIA